MAFPCSAEAAQECDEEGRRAVTRAEARQSRAEQGCRGGYGDHMAAGRVTSVKLRGRVELSTSIWQGHVDGLQEKRESLGHPARGRKRPRPGRLPRSLSPRLTSLSWAQLGHND